MDLDALETVRVKVDSAVCWLQLWRPEAKNTINSQLINECLRVLDYCERDDISVVVVEGLPDVFCFGADFGGLRDNVVAGHADESGPESLYDLWSRLALGPFVSVAHVTGIVNAGGNGFVAACDIVIADPSVRFSLSELLFGLYPAVVMPFLARRVGLQKANYLTVSTQPVSAAEAQKWGLVDIVDERSELALKRQLQRLRRMQKNSIRHYKRYLAGLDSLVSGSRTLAVESNREMHYLPGVVEGIVRYVETGKLPWEAA